MATATRVMQITQQDSRPRTFRHDPDAVLDYAFGWQPWLGENETIEDRTVLVTGTATVDSVTESDGTVTVFVSGATGSTVNLTSRIRTSMGRTDRRTLTLRVDNR